MERGREATVSPMDKQTQRNLATLPLYCPLSPSLSSLIASSLSTFAFLSHFGALNRDTQLFPLCWSGVDVSLVRNKQSGEIGFYDEGGPEPRTGARCEDAMGW
jgi:hypothetical protein